MAALNTHSDRSSSSLATGGPSANRLTIELSGLAKGAVLQGRYLIVRHLGNGGMGAVYEAVDQRLDATVALKETFSVDERLRRQFEQEARLLAQLHHPALPRVSDYFTEGERAFLVMQFIAGADLAEIVCQQPGPFPTNQVIAWADQLLDALIYLHTRDRQIIHRDIKPHNLKLTSTGQIVLLDFGLAKAHAGDASSTNSSNSIFGYTRRYSPLEQIQDQGTTPQSDIYALGATLYHLLTGVKPPDALARAAALANSKSDPLRPANELHGAVGPELATMLSRALALSAEDRYLSAHEFREALRQAGRGKIRVDGNSIGLSVSDRTGAAPVDKTIVRKTAVATVDPFDRYSILKPDEGAWLMPKPSRRPLVIAAVLSILMVAGFVTFDESDHRVAPANSVWDFARATSGNDQSGTTLVHQSKSDISRPKPSALKNVSTGSVGEISRKNETQKRRASVVNGARSKTPRS